MGHGHVVPRPDGHKVRCGGPGICHDCSIELVRHEMKENVPEEKIEEFKLKLREECPFCKGIRLDQQDLNDLAFTVGKLVGMMGRQDVKKFLSDKDFSPSMQEVAVRYLGELSGVFYK